MSRPRQTHCKRGHAYTPENTVLKKHWRNDVCYISHCCRKCKNDNDKIKRYYKSIEDKKIHEAIIEALMRA